MADTGTTQIVGKAGIATSEFWVVALTLLGNFLTHIFGHDWGIAANAQQIVLFATAAIASIYALARSWVKVGTHKAIATENSANASASKSRFQLLNLDGVTTLFDNVTGDIKILVKEEQAALRHVVDEQKAIGNEAVQDVHNIAQSAPSFS